MKWQNNLKRRLLSLRGGTLSLAAFPLWAAGIIGLFQGRGFKTAAALSAALCITAAARLTKRYFSDTAYGIATADSRQTALLLTAAGVGIISTYVLRRPIFIGLSALSAGLLYYYHYIFSVMPADTAAEHSGEAPLKETPPKQEPLSADKPDCSALNEALKADIQTAFAAADTIQNAVPKVLLLAAKNRAARLNYPLENDPIQRYDSKRRHLAAATHALLKRAAASETQVRKLRPLLVNILPEIADTAVKLTSAVPNEQLLINFTAVIDGTLETIRLQQEEFSQAQHRALDIKIDVLNQQINATKQQLL